MCKQKLISNKFDLNWSTTYSHTGAQRFLRNPAPYAMYHTQIKKWHKRTRYYIPYLLRKRRSVIVKKWNTEKDKNDKLQTPEFVLLLQTVQSPARRMPDPDSRQPTLHKQQGQKILAKKIHWWGNDSRISITSFSTHELCDTIDG